MQELGHELGHLVKYDKDEKTAENVGSKIDTIKPGEEKDYKEYLASIKDKYKDLPSLEESKELENKIPEVDKEFAVPIPLPVLVGGVVLIGGYYYIQNSEGNKETWNKFQEDIKKEWESVKDKGIAYAEFHQIYMEAFLAKQNIIIGAEEGIVTLPFPWEIPINLPTHTGNTDVLPKEKTSPPPTSLGVGSELDVSVIVDPLLKEDEKHDLTTADKNSVELNNTNILFITEKEAREKYKNALNKTKVEGVYGKSKSNSDILRDQLVKAGVEEPNYSNAAHHIVAALGTGMEEAVRILEKLGIDLNSASNGVFLSTKKANKTDYDTETLHSGPNGADYKKTFNNKIKKVYEDGVKKGLSKEKITEKVVEEINKIKIDLLTGKEKINNAKP